MRLSVDNVLGGVDVPAFKAAVRGTFMGKYGTSLRHGATEAIDWARAFRLEGCDPCRVLDIGCGSSIFARACSVAGHDVTGLDQPGYMHAELARLMGVKFIEHKVTTAEPLPNFPPETFDVITMMHVANHGGSPYYRALAGAAWGVLRPGGCWWIAFHDVAKGWVTSPLWAEWFDGTITPSGSRVLLLEKKP